MKAFLAPFVLLFSSVWAAPAARAQEGSRAVGETISMSGSLSDSGSYRSKANDWMIMPDGSTTLGGSLRFLTAPAGTPGMDDGLAFTDVVLSSINARHAFGKRFEIFFGASFLPKQPSFTDERVWQNAAAGMRAGFGKRYAFHLTGSGGALMGDRGMWGSGGAGLQARKSLHATLMVEGDLGSSWTALFENDRSQPSWLIEANAGGQLVFHEPHGMMGAWVGTEFHFPVADGSVMSDAGAAPYDPQTRVSFEIGGVLSYIDDWDIVAKLSVFDRGDAVNPETTLPILDGGFDQTQIMIGLTRHFRPSKSSSRPMQLAE